MKDIQKDLILVVDDEPENINVVVESLKNEFKIMVAQSGLEAIELAHKHEPKMILLDVLMPQMSGLEVCEKIKNESDIHDIPIIFLSANDSVDDRLKGYSAGGDDFIGKPFDKRELIAKTHAALSRKKRIEAARYEIKASGLNETQLMNTIGEMSVVTQFLRATFSCKSYSDLAQKTIAAHQDLDLDISIELFIDGDYQYFQTAGIGYQIEESAFNFVRSKGRLVDFGVRTAVNYPRVCIIIRNMPVHDKEYYGRVKDYIALFAQGVDSRILSITADLLVQEQFENLTQILAETKDAVGLLEDGYKQQQEESIVILSDTGTQIEESFLHLGLSGQQEDFLISIIEGAETKSNNLYESGIHLKNNFNTVLQKMESAVKTNVMEETVEEEIAEAITFF